MATTLAKYQKYAAYKESQSDWMGKIPAQWSLSRLKYIFSIKKRIAGNLGHEVLSITQKGIKVKDTESGDGQLSMDYSKYQLVHIGDFAMNHMDLSSVAVKPPTLGGGYKATPQSCLHTDGI